MRGARYNYARIFSNESLEQIASVPFRSHKAAAGENCKWSVPRVISIPINSLVITAWLRITSRARLLLRESRISTGGN